MQSFPYLNNFNVINIYFKPYLSALFPPQRKFYLNDSYYIIEGSKHVTAHEEGGADMMLSKYWILLQFNVNLTVVYMIASTANNTVK